MSGQAQGALIEHVRSPFDGEVVTWEWYCPVPDEGVPFVVLRQEWDETYSVRRIYQIRIGAHGEARPGP